MKFGAEGIGLCRTEHMFFEATRIKAMREMIVAKTVEARKAALAKILPYQQGDFEAMYKELEGRPMTVRFLDPPLHEFLPTKEEDIVEIAKELNISVEELKDVIASLHEFNPMMGHRGCRLAVTYPEIAEMQTTAVITAALNVMKEHPEYHIVPEIMIPLVGEVKELKYVKDVVVQTADKLIAEAGSDMHYKVGTMIEIPRAALTADEIAQEAEFFSFGTNDLTQMTFGFSRDDAGKFLDAYYDKKIYEFDPFAHLDQHGVGRLVEMAVKLGRETRPDIKLGICGEHGGDPRLCGVLPQGGPGVCLLQPLPRSHCPPGRRPGRHQESPQVTLPPLHGLHGGAPASSPANLPHPRENLTFPSGGPPCGLFTSSSAGTAPFHRHHR